MIRSVAWSCLGVLGIARDESWIVRLVKMLGSIKGIHRLELNCRHDGSCDFHPFQAVNDALNNAPSLRALHIFTSSGACRRDLSGIVTLANNHALQEHTALQEFHWNDLGSPLEAQEETSFDPVLWALATRDKIW
jgi:hypothetical protein